MRPVQILDRPVATPGMCVKCSSQNKEHFVDLGIDSEMIRKDDWGTEQRTTGVIYLCNDCMTDVIVTYMQKLFRFINTQRVGKDLAQAQDTQRLSALIAEINTLQEINGRKDEQILFLQGQIDSLRDDVAHKDDKTAAEIVATLIGEEVEVTDGPRNVDPNSARTESDAEGSNSDSSGNESGPEFDSLTVTHQAASGGFLSGAGFLS